MSLEAKNFTSDRTRAWLRENKAEIICIMREDETILRTGVIRSERQVSEMTCARFRSHDQEKE